MNIDLQTIGYAIGGLITGVFAGSLAVYKIIKRNFPVSDSSVSGIKEALNALENRIEATFNNKISKDIALLKKEVERTYLTIESYVKDRELDELRMTLSIRKTLDETFMIRDKKLDDHFTKIESMVNNNRQVVTEKMEEYSHNINRFKEQNAEAHQMILDKIR